MSSWVYIILAGCLEVGWSIGLRYTEGFTRLVPSVLTIAAIIASMWLLAVGARGMPIGTAYAVWVGIGATGAAILGAALFREPFTLGRGIFLALLVVAIIGLKLTAPAHDEDVSQVSDQQQVGSDG